MNKLHWTPSGRRRPCSLIKNLEGSCSLSHEWLTMLLSSDEIKNAGCPHRACFSGGLLWLACQGCQVWFGFCRTTFSHTYVGHIRVILKVNWHNTTNMSGNNWSSNNCQLSKTPKSMSLHISPGRYGHFWKNEYLFEWIFWILEKWIFF